jgi:peptide/nickel transport system permease protein
MPERSPETALAAPALDEVELIAPEEIPPTGPAAGPRRRRMGPGFWVAVAWLVAISGLAATARWLPLPGPNEVLAGPPRSGPSWDHLLGTDKLGYDLLSRVIHGARVSLVVGFASIALGMVAGGTVGLVAGYYRGRVERVLMGAMDAMLAFPALVLALAFVSFAGQSLRNVVLAIAILSVPAFARIARASTLVYSQREFVVAARTLGATGPRIMVREILPNVALPVASFAVVAMAVAIVAEGALSFLGLSVQQVTWGSMIAQGKEDLTLAPQSSLVPSGAMFLTVMSLNFVGDRLRSLFDVREAAI